MKTYLLNGKKISYKELAKVLNEEGVPHYIAGQNVYARVIRTDGYVSGCGVRVTQSNIEIKHGSIYQDFKA